MDHSNDPDSPSYVPPYTNGPPPPSRAPNLLPTTSHPTRFPSFPSQFNLATSGITAAIFTLPLHYLQSVPVHGLPLGQQINGLYRFSISIGNPTRLPGLRTFIRHCTPNWIARQGARVWTYGVLSHVMAFGSGAGDWRRGRGEGRREGLATNPVVIAAMAGFGSGVVDAFVEEWITIGVVLRATYTSKEAEPKGPVDKAVAASSNAGKKATEERGRIGERTSSDKAGWRKNQSTKPQPTNQRSTYTPPSRQKAPSPNPILPYASKQKPTSSTADFLDFGTVQRLQRRMNMIEGGVKWSIMSAFQVWHCRSWPSGGGNGDISEQETRTWPPPSRIAFVQGAGAGIVGEVAAMQLRSLFPALRNTELLVPWRWRLLGRGVRGAMVGGTLLTVQDVMVGRSTGDF